MSGSEALLRVSGLTKIYGERRSWLKGKSPHTVAVDDVSFEIMPREAFGLVGESGSGKTTVGRLALRLLRPNSGEIWFQNKNITNFSAKEMKPVRRHMQVVFQDPYSALNPRMTVGDFVAEPLIVHRLLADRRQIRERVEELFAMVGLSPSFRDRYPHEFSGGQRQRVGIARALALNPALIVADEPITALDVSIQAQIVNLFKDLQEKLDVSYLFITHDLSMVRYLCHRVAVMCRGRIVELGPTSSVFEHPLHAYTRALLSAIPVPDPAIESKRKRILFDQSEMSGMDTKLVERRPNHFVLA